MGTRRERRVRAKLRSFLREAPSLGGADANAPARVASRRVLAARDGGRDARHDDNCAEDALLASASSLDGSLDVSYGSDDFGNSGDFEAFSRGDARRASENIRARVGASPGTAERFQLALADILDHNARVPRVRATRTTARVSRVFRSRSYIIVGSSSSRVRSRRVRVSPFFFFFF